MSSRLRRLLNDFFFLRIHVDEFGKIVWRSEEKWTGRETKLDIVNDPGPAIISDNSAFVCRSSEKNRET